MDHFYYVDVEGRGCTLIVAKSLTEAKRLALYQEGADHVKAVRLATEDDVSWHRAMGGRVPGATP